MIVGGGLHCRLYIQSLFCRDHMQNPFEIVGIVDDCKGLKRLNLYGFDVLGTSRDLGKLYQKFQFNQIVITPESLQEEVQDSLKQFQIDHPDVEVLYFHLTVDHSIQKSQNTDREKVLPEEIKTIVQEDEYCHDS